MINDPATEGGTEIFDADIPRVDAVDGPAHGMPFLILKSDKPAGAMPDGSYPITDRASLRDAIHAVGRGKAPHDQIRRHIIARAHTLGATSEIPENWADDGSIKKAQEGDMTEPVQKADDTDDLVAEAADADGPKVDGTMVDPEKAGDAQMPGSPTWEAVDAAAAREALSQMVPLRALVQAMADREQTELDTDGDGDDSWNHDQLCDAASAIDCVIGILAKFAVDEQDTADQEAAEAQAQARALGLIKSLSSPVVKAGRVLSGANEAAIRQAAQAIEAVLAQLDSAPVAAEGGEPVKVAKSEQVEQVEKSALPIGLQQLFDQLLAGVEQYLQTSPSGDGAAPAADPAQAPTAPADQAAAPVADDAPAQPVADAQEAPMSDTQTPAADQAAPTAPAPAAAPKADEQTDVAKSIQDVISKALAPLMERIEKIESQPVNDGPMQSGQQPGNAGEPVTRDQDSTRDELRKQLGEETDPGLRMRGVAALIQSGLPRI